MRGGPSRSNRHRARNSVDCRKSALPTLQRQSTASTSALARFSRLIMRLRVIPGGIPRPSKNRLVRGSGAGSHASLETRTASSSMLLGDRKLHGAGGHQGLGIGSHEAGPPNQLHQRGLPDLERRGHQDDPQRLVHVKPQDGTFPRVTENFEWVVAPNSQLNVLVVTRTLTGDESVGPGDSLPDALLRVDQIDVAQMGDGAPPLPVDVPGLKTSRWSRERAVSLTQSWPGCALGGLLG